MTDKDYNWWDDPKNKEIISLPIAVTKDEGSEWWVATCSKETEKFLGDRLQGCAQGKTKEEAIEKMFQLIRWLHEYEVESCLNYQRWVPFRKGDWGHIGGSWFVIFGIHVYFRYGKGMQGGRYIPFTKLNISIHSEWATYRKYKKKNNQKSELPSAPKS